MARNLGGGVRTQAIAVIALILATALSAGSIALREGQLERAEDERPVALDFSLTTVDGDTFQLFEKRGRVVLIDLMATWCGECRSQMPMLNRTYQDHAADMVVISVGMDYYETDDDLRQFRREVGVNWPFALDRASSVYGAFFPPGFPTIVIVDAKGKVAFQHTGGLDEDELRLEVDKALAL